MNLKIELVFVVAGTHRFLQIVTGMVYTTHLSFVKSVA